MHIRTMLHRWWRASSISLVAAMPLSAVAAQDVGGYPGRPVRVIVQGGPGASDDYHARLITQKWAEFFGQPFVIDNRPGAGGLRAQSAVVSAQPDGHTLLLTGRSITTAKALNATIPFDPQRALVPASSIASYPFALVVHPTFKANSVKDYIAVARAQPGMVKNADSGRGLIPFLAAVLFQGKTAIDFQSIPYKEFPPLVADLLTARVDSSFLPAQVVLSHVAEGRLRALGVTSATRTPVMPEVPTIAEAAVPGYEASSWLFFAAPAGTSSRIVESLNAATARALALPEVRSALLKVGSDPLVSSTSELRQRVTAATDEFARVARTLGIRPQ